MSYFFDQLVMNEKTIFWESEINKTKEKPRRLEKCDKATKRGSPNAEYFFQPEVETLCWAEELYGSVLHGSGSHWQRYVHFYASCYTETSHSARFRLTPIVKDIYSSLIVLRESEFELQHLNCIRMLNSSKIVLESMCPFSNCPCVWKYRGWN